MRGALLLVGFIASAVFGWCIVQVFVGRDVTIGLCLVALWVLHYGHAAWLESKQ